MFLSRPNNVGCFAASSSASLFPGLDVETKSKTGALRFEETKERIKKLFDKVELSVSAYDTAWVAMVPSPNSLNKPLFPECINWVLDNQHPDGSWGILHDHQLLTKATLLSTLACVLTLKRWNIGHDHMSKALSFIKSNIASATDEKQHSPVGFDIIFPGMIEQAKDLNLNLPLAPMNVDALVQKKELELRRRNLLEEEIEEWAALSSLLPQSMNSNRADSWLWNLEKDNNFPSKSLSLALSTDEQSIESNLLRRIWSGRYPKKVKFFIWEISHSCVNTFDKLQRRSPWISISPSCCPMCMNCAETLIHLISDCPFASMFWKYIQCSFGWSFPRPGDTTSLLSLVLTDTPFKKDKETIWLCLI